MGLFKFNFPAMDRTLCGCHPEMENTTECRTDLFVEIIVLKQKLKVPW